ncbi:MAG: anti-sigma factor domain-containing protein [Acidimicrobiia bacterium]
MQLELNSHETAQELLGAFALNAVEPFEAVLIESHISGCDECRREVEQHLEVAAALSASERFAPPAVWESISGAIDPPETDLGPVRPPTPLRRSRHWLRPVAIAAVISLMAGAVVVQSLRLSTANSELAAALDRSIADAALAQSAADPASRRVTLGSEVSGSNAIIVLLGDGTGYLAEHTLQPLGSDRTYQLWAIVDGKVISAAVLGQDPGVVPFRIDPEGFEGFAITEESLGGVESSLNDPIVAWLTT